MVNRTTTSRPSSDDPIVELKVKSLHGISWTFDDEGKCSSSQDDIPPVVATVAFSGSASSMEVSSSSMCGRTGHLAIESDSLDIDIENMSNQGKSPQRTKDKKSWLVAGFHGTELNGDEYNKSNLSLLGDEFLPHLRFELPPRLSQAKDGSLTLPEIVELHITLRNLEDNSIFDEGIAHLVLFGNQTQSNIVDLPIKKSNNKETLPASPSTPTSRISSMNLESKAFVRVQVCIVTSNPSDVPYNTASTRKMKSNLYSRRLGGILEQLRQNEECAAERAKAAKWKIFDRKKPVHDLKNIDIMKKRQLSSRFTFCGGFEFMHTIHSFFDAVRDCDPTTPTKNGRGIVFTDSFMESTIATRESHNI